MSREFPNQFKIRLDGTIVKGSDGLKPASDEACGSGVRLATMGQNIKDELLPYSRYLGNDPTEFIPPEAGAGVAYYSDTTTGDGVILGCLPNQIIKDAGSPGNFNLASLLESAINHVANIKSAPKSLKTAQKDGAEIREVVDDKMWSLALARGLPSALGLKPLSGIQLDQVKNISTAIQSFASIPTSSMLGSLPGMNMSLGSMISKLVESGAKDKITKALPNNDIKVAFESLTNLITSVETAGSSAYMVESRVNPDVFLANAEDMLSQCRDISDMVNCLNELQSNTALHGLDTLGTITAEANTPFGTIELTIDINGKANPTINVNQLVYLAGANATSNTTNVIIQGAIANTVAAQPKKSTQDAMQDLMKIAGMMQSASQAFAMSGQAFFGDSAVRQFDMMQRLNTTSGEAMKKMVETLHQGQKANKLDEVTTFVRDGGKIFTGIKR